MRSHGRLEACFMRSHGFWMRSHVKTVFAMGLGLSTLNRPLPIRNRKPENWLLARYRIWNLLVFSLLCVRILAVIGQSERPSYFVPM
jgi:hypothetical protein